MAGKWIAPGQWYLKQREWRLERLRLSVPADGTSQRKPEALGVESSIGVTAGQDRRLGDCRFDEGRGSTQPMGAKYSPAKTDSLRPTRRNEPAA